MSEKIDASAAQGPDDPDSQGAADQAPGTADLAEALAQAEAKAEEHREQYLRAAAELDNMRKRADREVEKARRYGIESFARDLLAVIDSLEMGVQAGADASAESLLEGKQATLKLLLGAVEKAGIEVIDPEGHGFDPELHEAMTMQPSATAEPGSVLAVIQKGYRLNGRLLRPARVIVATEPDEGGENAPDGA